MQILLVNDDGIYAPSLWILRDELAKWGDVTVVAPSTEQSGVGHSITFLHPLLAHKEFRHGEFVGWKVDGRPADCVKLGIHELCPKHPDVIVSGLNTGANVGLNILYSGTVSAALEGAFFGIPSIALSQWMDGTPDFHSSARRAIPICKRLVETAVPGVAWNVNFPSTREGWPTGVQFVGMETVRNKEDVETRIDPRGRTYYWSGLNPLKSHRLDPGTDVMALQEGKITITPLQYDLTHTHCMSRLQNESWSDLV